jgi:3-oxoacyl-[acyl-carrier protein] reductase
MDLGLKDQVAIVTAASRGLGKAVAKALSEEGAKVVVCSRSDRIDSTAEEIGNQTGGEVVPVRADVTVQEDIDRLVQETVDRFGHVDILFVNAGGPPPGGFLALTPDDWKQAVDLTLMSAVRLCHAVAPLMVERGSGSIVTTQSYSVKQPIDNLILSNSIRLAVIGMIKTMANELGPHGVRVNSINPAWTSTERVDQLLKDRAERNGTTVEEEAAKLTAAIPLKRMGTPEEFGKTVAWLASPAASFIHGQAIYFDGGMTKASL